MSRLSELILQLKRENPELGKEIEKEVRHLQDRRAFGLNFERHRPETVELYGRPVRKGDKVKMLPPRGETKAPDDRLWIVTGAKKVDGARVATLKDRRTDETAEYPLDDLVVVAESHDTIYPGLVSTGKIERGGDKPFHTVINGENLHALKMLLYTHRGKIDVIYIDPPYNTGGKGSWLYNDNYVDTDDLYMHSKWLAFLERRLQLAKELLKPSGAIMISIGDDEQHRLRMLMDQVFGTANQVAQLAVEMSTTSGPKTTNAQQGTIVKNVEYVLIYRRSPAFDTEVRHTPLYDSVKGWDKDYSLWLNDDGTIASFYEVLAADPAVWADIVAAKLIRKDGKFAGAQAMDRLLAFSDAANAFVESNLDHIARRDTPPVSVKGIDPPIRGWIEVEADHRTYFVTRLKSGTINQVYTLRRNYRVPDESGGKLGRTVIRGDLWRGFHQDMGTVSREGGVAFSNGKKPVRLIKQLIRWANNRPDALVLDFFAGSGTTAHAVMAMNAEDGGSRSAVLITNNEINEETAGTLRKSGLRPDDDGWERLGVCQAVTIPRVTNVATSTSSSAEFFTLTYEAPLTIATHHAFERIAPMLWLRAGATGRRISDLEKGWDVADTYGVIADLDHLDDFLEAVSTGGKVRIAYIVTDDDRQFAATCSALPERVEPVRLYESYLRNFQIDARRSSR